MGAADDEAPPVSASTIVTRDLASGDDLGPSADWLADRIAETLKRPLRLGPAAAAAANVGNSPSGTGGASGLGGAAFAGVPGAGAPSELAMA